jgi:hypothetical protein
VAAQVVAALGEDQPRILRPAEQGDQYGGVLAAVRVDRERFSGIEEDAAQVAQMITCTVPPSTLQAAPAT